MVGRDRTLFFAFFAAGALLILTLKRFDAPQLVVTAFPCALMLWYAAWLWDWENKRPRFDSTGDNLYYIGFLYTLTSLAHSLYRFNADPNDTETIVSNFGIAISTTILGMALRILLGQTPVDDPAEIETAARLDLASSARKLRAEMDYTIETFHAELEKDFKDFRKRLERGFEEAESGISRTFGYASTLQGVIEAFEKDMREVTGALRHQARALEQSVPDLKQFEKAVAELDDCVGAASSSLLKHADALGAGADAVRTALELQADRLRADFLQALLDHATAAVSTELGATADKFSALLDQLQEADGRRDLTLAASQKATTKLTEALDENRRLAKASIDAIHVSHDVAASLQSASETISRFTDGVQEAARQVSGACNEFSRSADQVRTVNDELTQASAALAPLVRDARRVQRQPRRRWFMPWRK